MPVTQSELDHFHDFATKEIQQGDNNLTLEDLLILWQNRGKRDDVNGAIARGLKDIDTGNHRSAEEVLEDLCNEIGSR